MKKIAILTSVLSLAACTTYHTGKMGATMTGPDIKYAPQEAKLSVNTREKMTGTASCESFLWIFNSVPERQAYGPKLQVSEGTVASNECMAAAMYDAMSKSDADVIVAPQYTNARDGFLCFGSRCLVGTTKVIVKGYAGKVVSINEVEKKTVTTTDTKKKK